MSECVFRGFWGGFQVVTLNVVEGVDDVAEEDVFRDV